MRIRQVRPEFWSDETLAALPDPVRLFYIGLWGVADDAGWLEWQPRRIGALLYPYRAAHRRESDITAWAAKLVTSGRMELLDCGCAFIPTLRRHQRISGTRAVTYADRHFSKHTPLTTKQSSLSRSPVTLSNVEVSNVSAGATSSPSAEDFKEKLAAYGGKKP